MDNVEQSCDDQAPQRQQHSDQDIDREKQESQQEQIPPVRLDECFRDTAHTDLLKKH